MKTANKKMILWGTPHSLYTGKVRSYLIKKGLPFRELLGSHPRFQSEIVPRVGHLVVPVLEFADGELLQDSTDIIEALESRNPDHALMPKTPLQTCVAHLLNTFGSEGLLPPAMHYRWSYRAEQENFLRAEFGRAVHAGPNREERLAAGAKLMDYFNGFLPALGVNAETIPAFEAAHEELLDALDIHFQHYPYLLGGRPSIADFGFMAPLFAHLGRDPVPASLMKRLAPNVYRWVERMNLAGIADPEFPGMVEDYLPDDEIPTTLDPVLRLLFQDWGVQLLAEAAHVNGWLSANAALPAGTMLNHDSERKVHPILGFISHPWRGVTVQRASMPHGLWRFAQVAEQARQLDGDALARLSALVERTEGAQVMSVRLARGMHRADNVLVLD